jgi:pimeloyl-ACP methyl ester carboxylesterase
MLAGDSDPIYPIAKAQAGKIPNATFVTIPGQNHVGTLFQSDLMVSHIMQFLRGVA